MKWNGMEGECRSRIPTSQPEIWFVRIDDADLLLLLRLALATWLASQLAGQQAGYGSWKIASTMSRMTGNITHLGTKASLVRSRPGTQIFVANVCAV